MCSFVYLRFCLLFRQLEEDISPTGNTDYYPGKYLIQSVRNIREQVAAEANNLPLSSKKRKNKKSKGSSNSSSNSAKKQSSWRTTEEGAEMAVLSSTTNAMHSSGHGVFSSQKKLIFRIIAHEGIPPGMLFACLYQEDPVSFLVS